MGCRLKSFFLKLLLLQLKVVFADGEDCNKADWISSDTTSTADAAKVESCPQVLSNGGTCSATCPGGYEAADSVRCEDGNFSVPACIETTTTSSHTITSTSLSGTNTITATATATTSTTSMTGSETTTTSMTVTTSTITTYSSMTTTSSTGTASTYTSTSTSATTATNTSTTTITTTILSDCIGADVATGLGPKGSNCPRYMMHGERCTAQCIIAAEAMGSFVCLGGYLFGHSACQKVEEQVEEWRGDVVAVGFRTRLSAVTKPSTTRMVDALRRAVATSVGVASNRVVRLTIESMVQTYPDPHTPTQLEVILQDDGTYDAAAATNVEFVVEFTFEIALFNDGISVAEVKATLIDLDVEGSVSFKVYNSVLQGYYSITAEDIKPMFRPYSYWGNAFNAVGSGEVYGLSAPLSDLEPDYTSLISGLILSLIVMPLVAALVHWIGLERRMKREIDTGDRPLKVRMDDVGEGAGTPRDWTPRVLGASRMQTTSPSPARVAMSPSPPQKPGTESSKERRQKLPAPATASGAAASGSESVASARSKMTAASNKSASSSSTAQVKSKRPAMPPPPTS